MCTPLYNSFVTYLLTIAVVQPENQKVAVTPFNSQASVHFGERGEHERVSVGQRLQHTMIVKLRPTTDITSSVERNDNGYISGVIMMPSPGLFALWVVVRYLH